MNLVLTGLAVLLVGGVASLVFIRSSRLPSAIGPVTAVVGSGLVAIPALLTLAGSGPAPFRHAWSMPGGSLALALDPLSAVFLIAILVLGAASAIYGAGYLRGHSPRGPEGMHWLWFNTLVASMALVVVSRNGLLFLLAWEGMALSSFFLVSSDDHLPEVRGASVTYLVATHLGTAFLLILFTSFAAHFGSSDFSAWTGVPPARDFLFVLAIIGFGSKAGIVPFHVWLPEAHPSAPSHVSALMSGAMIKTGIYGILRFLTLLGPPEQWWGVLLIGIGLASGVLGVLFALAQHDLKRLLAYHSVENIGIIVLGIGLESC